MQGCISINSRCDALSRNEYFRPELAKNRVSDNVSGSPQEDCCVPASEMGEDEGSTKKGRVGSTNHRTLTDTHESPTVG
jgi:hypothetical protein